MNKDNPISPILHEKRIFNATEEFKKNAFFNQPDTYQQLVKQARENPEQFWASIAQELYWHRYWDRVLDWQPPWVKWFVGGQLNLTYNCLDRYLETEHKHKAAFIWEGECGKVRTLTYQQLHHDVSKFANVLKDFGVQPGDRIAIYMGMVPELPIAMLACARIGAVHLVIFGGFSAQALADRLQDSQANIVITQDSLYRRGKNIALKTTVDHALTTCPFVKTVIVYQRTSATMPMQTNRDYWWHECMQKVNSHCPAEPFDAEHPLFILYTSGTTGKPKGIVHTVGGYAVGTYITTQWVLDINPRDIYWCTADIGWITGHSYVVYGPLQNGATCFIYEGALQWPEPDRCWKMIQHHNISIFYTAPTAIRSFMQSGDHWLQPYPMSSLRLLGTVGEPINPSAWMWFREQIGHNRCPIIDTWWQTETGMMMIAPFPALTPTKPGSATYPLPGIEAEIVDADGQAVPRNVGGYLVIKRPWPAMLRNIYNDPERYAQQYWSTISGVYFTGDAAYQDQDGYFWILGRVDDVLNVSGHRLSTIEIESALVAHPNVTEAAIVSRPDPIKGEAIVAFVTLHSEIKQEHQLVDKLKEWVTTSIGAIARPEEIRIVAALPKTRSGKIMRRLLRELATEGKIQGDTTTLEELSIINQLRIR